MILYIVVQVFLRNLALQSGYLLYKLLSLQIAFHGIFKAFGCSLNICRLEAEALLQTLCHISYVHAKGAGYRIRAFLLGLSR